MTTVPIIYINHRCPYFAPTRQITGRVWLDDCRFRCLPGEAGCLCNCDWMQKSQEQRLS